MWTTNSGVEFKSDLILQFYPYINFTTTPSKEA